MTCIRMPRTGPADFGRHDDQGLDPLLATASEPSFVSANEALVDLDFAGERLSLGIDHRTAQLVEHRPGLSYRLRPSWRCNCSAEIPGVAVVTK